MRLNGLTVGFLIIFAASETIAANIVNFGAEYAAFVSASHGKTLQETEIEWKKFEARHQSIYDEAVFRKGDGGTDERAEQKRQSFFAEYESLTPKMSALFSDADQLVHDQESRFKAVFPDLATDIPVIFLPSLSSFNGKVKQLSAFGRPTLLMGVDFIVKRNDNLNVLFAHEFFHVYHESHLSVGSTGRTMATPLWKEGFATYVSGVLNPDRSDDVLLMDASLSKSCGRFHRTEPGNFMNRSHPISPIGAT